MNDLFVEGSQSVWKSRRKKNQKNMAAFFFFFFSTKTHVAGYWFHTNFWNPKPKHT